MGLISTVLINKDWPSLYNHHKFHRTILTKMHFGRSLEGKSFQSKSISRRTETCGFSSTDGHPHLHLEVSVCPF